MSKTNREYIERARGTLAYLDGSCGKMSTDQADRFLDYIALISIEDRLATFRWWKIWRWRQQRRLRRRWAELSPDLSPRARRTIVIAKPNKIRFTGLPPGPNLTKR